MLGLYETAGANAGKGIRRNCIGIFLGFYPKGPTAMTNHPPPKYPFLPPPAINVVNIAPACNGAEYVLLEGRLGL